MPPAWLFLPKVALTTPGFLCLYVNFWIIWLLLKNDVGILIEMH